MYAISQRISALITFAVFTVIFNLGYTQVDIASKSKDELKAFINSNKKEGCRANYYLGKNHTEDIAIKSDYYKKVLECYKGSKQFKEYYSAVKQLIRIEFSKSNITGAIELFEEYGNKNPSTKVGKIGQASLYNDMCSQFEKIGDIINMQKYLDGFKAFKNKNPIDGVVYSYFKREGIVAYNKADIKSAQLSFENALKFIDKSDTNEVSGLNMNIAILKYRNGYYDDALLNFRNSLEGFKKTGSNVNIGHAWINIASVYYSKDILDSVYMSADSAAHYYELANDSLGMSSALEYKGSAAHNSKDFEQALKAHLKSLEIRKANGNDKLIAISYGNIAYIYGDLKDSVMHKQFLQKIASLPTFQSNPSIRNSYYGSMAAYYSERKNFDSTLYYYELSGKVAREQNNPLDIALNLLSLGNTYKSLAGDLDKALDYYEQSYKIFKELNDVSNYAGLAHNIGVIYEEKGEHLKALKYVSEAYDYRKSLQNNSYFLDSYITLANINTHLGRYKESHDFLRLYIDLKDSVFSDNMAQQIAEMRTLYETQQIEDSLKLSQSSEMAAKMEADKVQAEKAIISEENKRKSEQIIWLIGIIVFAVAAIALAIRSNRLRKKANVALQEKNDEIVTQRDEIQLQKLTIEEKNKDILDSISYAKRLQTALLPDIEEFSSAFNDAFVLFRPKDIVSGDFYWMEEQGDRRLIAAADCTGHGVPGAMVSVICNNGLNRSVREYGLKEPGQILDKTREIVIGEFQKSQTARFGDDNQVDIKDGMDIALCSLSGNKLEFSGANNPLWIVSKAESIAVSGNVAAPTLSDNGLNLFEIKGDKQPIGVHDVATSFQNHSLELNQGDTVYIFSDGFADQFGGAKGKKFKYRTLKQILLTINVKSLTDQKNHLEDVFTKWMGDFEQLDDVCVIGIKV